MRLFRGNRLLSIWSCPCVCKKEKNCEKFLMLSSSFHIRYQSPKVIITAPVALPAAGERKCVTQFVDTLLDTLLLVGISKTSSFMKLASGPKKKQKKSKKKVKRIFILSWSALSLSRLASVSRRRRRRCCCSLTNHWWERFFIFLSAQWGRFFIGRPEVRRGGIKRLVIESVGEVVSAGCLTPVAWLTLHKWEVWMVSSFLIIFFLAP